MTTNSKSGTGVGSEDERYITAEILDICGNNQEQSVILRFKYMERPSPGKDFECARVQAMTVSVALLRAMHPDLGYAMAAVGQKLCRPGAKGRPSTVMAEDGEIKSTDFRYK